MQRVYNILGLLLVSKADAAAADHYRQTQTGHFYIFFCLLLLEPVQVNHLELRGEPQNHGFTARLDVHDWSTREV